MSSSVNVKEKMHVTRAKKTSDLPQSLQKIVGAFQMVPDPMARYKQLLFYATKLAPLSTEDHTPENKVEGCVSQVWVKPDLREDGKVYWQADSDSQLTKGLAALLVNGLSGCTPEEICRVEPNFIEMLGLKQSLTPSRNNGFLNMLLLMQRKSRALAASSFKKETSGSHADSLDTQNEVMDAATSASSDQAASTSTQAVAPAAKSTSLEESRTPIQDRVRMKLTDALKPIRLEIVDDSHKHAGHAAMRSMGAGKAEGAAETHFHVAVISAEFEGMPLVKRHRLIYQLLDVELSTMGLHALSLDTKTPSEIAST
ncbi:hypothetical protein CEUSTIGMA_g4305.t1 [Chlamydomonas eustigma]|uniref:Fe-S metabolism associated domain-containing protein n=1 Tax=Chlamydomonas eustigma TaxID=1157962 RepID=A0A250X1P5_9CHLO|nr:hypothetical protein CEUSTIGMA_g4305.t1 [Chlamydomonas eustigma]|eukprot:GAX76859.1 hypothetical protein CEUSTIGMA_g4305.t1 [Chlamydomonas eustigma]